MLKQQAFTHQPVPTPTDVSEETIRVQFQCYSLSWHQDMGQTIQRDMADMLSLPGNSVVNP